MNNMDEETMELVSPFYVSYVPRKSGTYRIYINGEINSPEQFLAAIEALDAADEDNDVQIYLQSPGGCVDSADHLMHAMRKCMGHIHIVATGGCHSMASQILLLAHTLELSDGFNSLIHCGARGLRGNTNVVKSANKFHEPFLEKQFKRAYEGFLTDKEIEDVLDGKDLWLDAQAWCERNDKRLKYFKNKEAKKNKSNTRKIGIV